MSPIKEKKLSQKAVKKRFSTIGLLLILYIILVMFIPYFFHYYLIESESDILNDDLLYYGLYFIFLVIGTFVPFYIMKKCFLEKKKRIMKQINATFVDLFVQTIVFFTICIALTYVSNILLNYCGLEGKLISGIGLSYEEADLNNFLYIFMLLIVSPILEEFAFRGVLLNVLSRYSNNFALYATSIIFALAHNNFAEMIPAFAMGIALGKTSLRYKSIQPTIVIHILFNVFLYCLFSLPLSISKYLAYGLAAISILALSFVLTGRYEKIHIQKSKSNALSNKLFYSRFTIIISMILMISFTCIFTIIK